MTVVYHAIAGVLKRKGRTDLPAGVPVGGLATSAALTTSPTRTTRG